MRMTRRHGASSASRASPTCRQVLSAISAYLDHDLPKPLCAAIRRHLDTCRACQGLARSLKRIISLCKHAGVARLSASEKRHLREKILAAVGRIYGRRTTRLANTALPSP
jgi:anti-sigma factor RsiW